jgi:hypothetical protein
MEALRKRMGGGGSKRSEGGKKRCGDIDQMISMRTDNQMTGQRKMSPMHPVFSLNMRQPGLRKSPRAVLILASVDSMMMTQMQLIHIPWMIIMISTFLRCHKKLLKLDAISRVGMRYAYIFNLRRDQQLTSDELIAIVPQEEIVQPVKHIRSSKSSGGKAVGATKTVPTAVKFKTESKGVPASNKTKETKKAVKDSDDRKTKKLGIINSNTVRVNNLPDFAKDQTWRKIFLPTLYDKFFASSNPFSQFAKGSKEFISLLQGIVTEVYPHVNYKVSASDTIHGLVSFPLGCKPQPDLPSFVSGL